MSARRAGRIVAVASGKGGVGKTWLSISLAHAVARGGRRVLLVDGDLGLANVDIQLGLLPVHDLGDVVARRVGLIEAAMSHREGGFAVLAGRSGSGALSTLDQATLEAMLREVSAAAPRFDTIVLDLGAGLDRAVRRMAAFADTLLVVATEEPTSITDAYAVLKLHAADRPLMDRRVGDARIVINQATSVPAGERTYHHLSRACASFLKLTPPLAGVIRRDDRVREAIRRQSLLGLLAPHAPAAADVAAIAASLAGERVAVPA